MDKARKPTIAETDAMFDDFYQILGVSPDASQDEIKKAYYFLATECHPDLHPDDKEARAKFQRIQQAFDVLGDPKRREKYDRDYDAQEPPPPPCSPPVGATASSNRDGPPPYSSELDSAAGWHWRTPSEWVPLAKVRR